MILAWWLIGCAGEVVEGVTSQAPEPIPVQVAEVAARSMVRSATWSGVVRGAEQATVLSEGGGRVTRVVIGVGDSVRASETLVILEDGRQRIGVQAAEASLAKTAAGVEAAERQLTRVEALGDAVSDADREDAATGLDLARADHRSAEVQLKARQRELLDTRIRAPFAGEVTALHLDLGQVIGAGTPVATVVDTRELVVRIAVPTTDAAALGRNTPARVADRPCRVDRVDRQVDGATGLVPVEVRCEADASWVIGAPVSVALDLGAGVEVLAVPAGALLERYGETLVYVVEGGVARARAVQLGTRIDRWQGISEGLSAGDQVVARGAERLTDGAPVEIVSN